MGADPQSALVRGWNYLFNFKREISPNPGTHRAYLILSLCFVLLPFFLDARGKDQPEMLFAGRQLPPMCLSKSLFNVECPGCGLTHSFAHLTHGRARESLRWNRAGVILYAFFVWQIFFRSLVLLRPSSITSPFWLNAQHFTSLGMIAILFMNWGAGIFLGANGS